MEFDLFTFIAQIINFFILLFLLYKFLFKKIKSVMDEREKLIADNVALAEKKKAEAEELIRMNNELTNKINLEKEEILNQVRIYAEELKNKMTLDLEINSRNEKEKFLLGLEAQRERFIDGLKIRSRDFVYSLTEKILKDLADEELEIHIIDVFILRIGTFPDEKTEKCKEIIRMSKDKFLIKSSFDIQQTMKNKIIEALKEKFQLDSEIKFEVANDNFCGVELNLGSYKISWNIEEYLTIIERLFFPIFNHKSSE